MELDELKQAWQTLGKELERHESISLRLLKEYRLDKARSNLRPLFWGLSLQGLLGIALIVVGVACWTSNLHVPGLLLSGILVHVFGLANAVLAVISMMLIGTIDYAAPVLRIQKRLALLLKLHSLNTVICGWPWWIMWLPLVVALAGLGGLPAGAVTPMWVWLSLAVGVAGLFGTWVFQHRRLRSGAESSDMSRCDGSDGLRRSRQLLIELEKFEEH